MGWCSGTRIFDTVLDDIINLKIPDSNKKKVIKNLIDALEDMDWDCQCDSAYYDDPFVREVFKEVHPTWFDDDDEPLSNVVVVMTGFRDDNLKDTIENAGGRVTSTVSSQTTHLLISGRSLQKGSSKLDKAEELGVLVMSPDEFIEEFELDI